MDNILIEAVYRREPLWNPMNDLHKNSNILKRLWQEVAAEVNRDAKTTKTRWKNLRAYYVKECQKIDSKSKEGSETTSTWQYFDRLQFLGDVILPGLNQTTDCIKEEDYEGDEIFITNIDGSVAYPENRSPAQSSSDTSYITPSTRKRKLNTLASSSEFVNNETLLELERKKVQILESDIARGSNDDLLFFESLLPFMNEIPLERKLRLRTKIQDLISNELEAVQNCN
ncbi:unnamed protein product [Parnassius apollo]|uniref:(apollo) hypothetical protein n=1 Tax=Parnassius apollo TaxID=110799 RepID=A0A8S3Y5N2_PARAO|nr:unnamed protein product [Parnassius apollo]